jgi:hypothetical protein
MERKAPTAVIIPAGSGEKHRRSVDSYFAPTAPKGLEKNWISTVPGQVWFNQINEPDQ